ncbi:NUDIX hydrolase [bacterium]|nr:MAG: NUDIX hydrolase [bacterium]
MNQRIAAKALITNGHQILLLREAATDIEATQIGNYQVPGGRIEPGESFFDGLKREVKEETGLNVTVGQPAFVCEWFPLSAVRPTTLLLSSSPVPPRPQRSNSAPNMTISSGSMHAPSMTIR